MGTRAGIGIIVAVALVSAAPLTAGAQRDSAWLAVAGWVNPDSAARRRNDPIPGFEFYDAGMPVTGTVIGGASMMGVDLMLRGAFRYHDSRGVAHGRSWTTALSGVAIGTVAAILAKSLAPSAAQRGNARRLAEADALARQLASSARRHLPGLAAGDTVLLRSRRSTSQPAYVVSAQLPATDLYFRSDGSVRSVGDSTRDFQLVSIRRRTAGPNPAVFAAGFVTGLGAAVVLCAKRFEACYPYTTMWITSLAGYNLGRLVPMAMTRTMSAAAVSRP